jgi:hypothetical protein
MILLANCKLMMMSHTLQPANRGGGGQQQLMRRWSGPSCWPAVHLTQSTMSCHIVATPMHADMPSVTSACPCMTILVRLVGLLARSIGIRYQPTNSMHACTHTFANFPAEGDSLPTANHITALSCMQA